MFWKWLWRSLVLLIVLLIFVGGGITIYRAGYMHGVAVEVQITDTGGEYGFPQTHPYFLSPIGFHHPRPLLILMLFGMLLFLPILMIILGGVFRFSQYSSWKTAGGPGSEEIGRFRHRPRPPHHWHSPWWESKPSDRNRPSEGPKEEDQDTTDDPKDNPKD
jgi:hypothetical protein